MRVCVKIGHSLKDRAYAEYDGLGFGYPLFRQNYFIMVYCGLLRFCTFF